MKIIFTIFRVKAPMDLLSDGSVSLIPVCEAGTLLPKLFDSYDAAEKWIKDDTTIDVTYQIQKLYCKL